MKRNWKLVVCLLMALVLLSSCTAKESPEDFPDITQAIGPTSTPAPFVPTNPPAPAANNSNPQAQAPAGSQSIFSANPYDVDTQEWTESDILSEEGYIDPEYDDALTAVQPEGTVYPYAGSTPIPLNPVDMPTPTPRPELKFTYSTYIASTVGVTFEGPVNWAVDESQPYMFILAEPASQIRDGQQCVITISAEPISGTYSQRDLESHVTQRLDTLYSSDYTSWKPSYTATRHMMGSTGVYANYSATTSSGVELGGRIQYVSIDHMLYGLEIIFPLGFKDDFIDVFGQVRTTMGLIK
ncbi:MAG: hypothetical protein PUD16_12210 [bacterium]|nr:hypothetical protein [bacterium]